MSRIEPIEYLVWAREKFGQTRFDLASSGVPDVTPAELGLAAEAFLDRTAPGRFRAAIASRYRVGEAEVALAPGTSGALWQALAAVTAPGDRVAVERPAYEPLWRVAQGLGAEVVRFDRPFEEGYRLDPGRVMAALGERGRIAVLSDLHNPTGAAADSEALRALAAALAARGGYLVVDEVYRDFAADRRGAGTARTLAPNVVAISSLTKVYGMGWARAGWILAPPPIASIAGEALVHAVGHMGWAPAAAGAAALARIDTLMARSEAALGDKLGRATRWVARRADLEWIAPQAGIFGLVRTRPARDVRALIAGPLAARGLLVADGRFFDQPAAFRLGLALDSALLDEALELLGAGLDADRM